MLYLTYVRTSALITISAVDKSVFKRSYVKFCGGCYERENLRGMMMLIIILQLLITSFRQSMNSCSFVQQFSPLSYSFYENSLTVIKVWYFSPVNVWCRRKIILALSIWCTHYMLGCSNKNALILAQVYSDFLRYVIPLLRIVLRNIQMGSNEEKQML